MANVLLSKFRSRTSPSLPRPVWEALRHSLQTYDEIAYFLQTDYFMRMSDVEDAFPMLPLHPDVWPYFMYRFSDSVSTNSMYSISAQSNEQALDWTQPRMVFIVVVFVIVAGVPSKGRRIKA